MALTRKNVDFDYIPSTKGDLYTPTSCSNGLIHNILIHNSNTASENIIIYYHDGTNEYPIFNIDLAANDTFVPEWIGEGFVVMDGAKITGVTDTASKVVIKIDGTEES